MILRKYLKMAVYYGIAALGIVLIVFGFQTRKMSGGQTTYDQPGGFFGETVRADVPGDNGDNNGGPGNGNDSNDDSAADSADDDDDDDDGDDAG